MAKLLKLRRGTTSEHSSFTGAEGECTVDTTKDTLVVHDGSTAAGRALLREDLTNIVAGSVTHAMLAGDAVDGDNIGDDVVNSEHIAAGAIDLEHMSSESVDEDNLKISNAGSNGQFLSKQSGNTGGLTWATVSSTPEGTAILSTGESGGTKYLREDGDGSCSWQTVASAKAGGSVYECVNTISSNYTMTTNSNGVSAGPIALSATVTIPSGSTWSIV